MPTLRRILPWFGALVGGLVLASAYPPFGFAASPWLWAIPVLWAIWLSEPGGKKPRRWRRGFALGYLFGTAFFTASLWWLSELPGVAVPWVFPPLLSLYLALFPAVWGAFAATVGRLADSDLSGGGDNTAMSPGGDGELRAAAREERLSRIQARMAAVGRDRNSRPGKGSALWGSSLATMRCALLNAAAWAGLEWLRGTLFSGFGWNGLGVSLADDPALIQICDVIGAGGLSFVLCFVAVMVAALLRRIVLEIREMRLRPHVDFALAISVVLLIFFYGLAKLNSRAGAGEAIPVRVLAVQMNTPQDIKWDAEFAKSIFDGYAEQTEIGLAAGGADLVVWPETALPLDFYHTYTQSYLEYVLGGADEQTWFAIGSNVSVPDRGYFNSILLMRGTPKSAAFYHKRHLVPFGEYLPLRGVFPPFEWVAGGLIPTDLTPGESDEPLRIQVDGAEIELMPLVCFEDTIARVARASVRSGCPQVLLNSTNDGWFGESAAARQHLHNALFRCIELRRPMIRAANTGVTCLIDSTGQVIEQAPPFTPAFIAANLPVPKAQPMTPYAVAGDWLPLGAGIIALGVAILRMARLRSRRHNMPSRPGAPPSR